jgi:subtilisin family serine protease
MAWMARARAVVINVSLVGPPNRLLEAAVRSLSDQGRIVVAAVGNDGPAAPPQYPASYPQVIAVSAVDRRGRPLIEAGRATHIDFCAPGADMAAPAGPSGFATVRGTSFAAPIVAGLLARELESANPAAARAAIDALGRRAVRAGPDCGRGVLGADLRASPQSLRAGPWPGS